MQRCWWSYITKRRVMQLAGAVLQGRTHRLPPLRRNGERIAGQNDRTRRL